MFVNRHPYLNCMIISDLDLWPLNTELQWLVTLVTENRTLYDFPAFLICKLRGGRQTAINWPRTLDSDCTVLLYGISYAHYFTSLKIVQSSVRTVYFITSWPWHLIFWPQNAMANYICHDKHVHWNFTFLRPSILRLQAPRRQADSWTEYKA